MDPVGDGQIILSQFDTLLKLTLNQTVERPQLVCLIATYKSEPIPSFCLFDCCSVLCIFRTLSEKREVGVGVADQQHNAIFGLFVGFVDNKTEQYQQAYVIVCFQWT